MSSSASDTSDYTNCDSNDKIEAQWRSFKLPTKLRSVDNLIEEANEEVKRCRREANDVLEKVIADPENISRNQWDLWELSDETIVLHERVVTNLEETKTAIMNEGCYQITPPMYARLHTILGEWRKIIKKTEYLILVAREHTPDPDAVQSKY